MSNFSNLNLDLSNIDPIIKEKAKIIDCDPGEGRTKYKLTSICSTKNCIVIIHHKKDGTTTLQPQGQNLTFATELCEHIMMKTKTFDINMVNCSLLVKEDDFTFILNQILEKYEDHISQKEVSGGIQFTFNKSKEHFVFKYYQKSSKLLLQGRPLSFFAYIATLLEDKDYRIIDLAIKLQVTVEIDTKTLLETHLPLSHQKLNATIKQLLHSSLIFINLNITLPEYSLIVYPSLRSIEHLLKLILTKNDIVVKKEFYMFVPHGDNFVLKPEYKTNLTDPMVLSLVEKTYTFYHKQRNGLFHASVDEIEIRTIETREEALDLLNQTFEIIEELSNAI